jgi:lipopolysaccharide cholinephosphotransferase
MTNCQKSISISEMREIQMDILKRVDELCQAHHLRYCLCGGTLLGAIRHKGYIPWDDDIDISMPRSDYMKFIELAPGFFGLNYTVSSPYNNDSHVYTFTKVYDNRTVLVEPGYPPTGVYIDIFPMDGLPDEIGKSNRIFTKIKILNTLLNAAIQSRSITNTPWITFIKSIFHVFCKPIGTKRFLRLIDKIASQYDFETSNFVAVSVVSCYGKRERCHKQAFSSFVKASFENVNFNIPIGYDEYLSNLYDDYMKLPPDEKRVTHHTYKVYWK